jgi:DNA-binding transcriptional regulator YhcF (GntR family)
MNSGVIQINKALSQAKYRQIIQSVIVAVRDGKLSKGEKLPSVNDIATSFNLSRDTVLLAYDELKKRGILKSVAGKGYYVSSTKVDLELRILLLFDELNAFKEDLYNSFIEHLAGKAEVDLFFHHFNPELFDSILKHHNKDYTTYVVMPAMLESAAQSIARLPADRVFILDQMPDRLRGKYTAVYQSFEEDIYNCLFQGVELLRKYEALILVYPGGKEPIGFLNGFQKFCSDSSIQSAVCQSIEDAEIRSRCAYILINDRDLVSLVKFILNKGLVPGKDIGIVSLNDTGLKEVVAGGITTISTDFHLMGATLADMILNNKTEEVRNPSRLILRNSL